MTLTEAVKLYGISTQAVYQRLKREGLTISALREGESKELS